METLWSVLKILKGFTNVDVNQLFSIVNSSRTRYIGIKRRRKQMKLDLTQFFFTNDVDREWNKLPPSMVQCITINSFKLNRASYKDCMTQSTADCLTI